jgi:MFS transporter, ACS family, D-galactonate transporter
MNRASSPAELSPVQAGVEGMQRTRVRVLMLSLITVATAINYLDRTVISVAAPLMSKDLGLSPALMGVAFAAFSWTYAASQIPGGIVLDRIGVRYTYFLSIALWSICTATQGFALGIASLVASRLVLGVTEAPTFPCNNRVLSVWFPQQERASATGVYSVGQYFGLAFLSPALFWLSERFGWRVLFFLVGATGLVYSFFWLAFYRDPRSSRAVNAAELSHISAGGGLGDSASSPPFQWSQVAFLLRQRQILGAGLGQFASNSTLVFFLTWFPTYLATERHMGWLQIGFFTVLPFIAATCGVVSGGIFSDWLLRKTGSANLARKLPIVAGLALASVIVTANFLQSDALVIAVLSVAFFGQGLCNLGWTLLTDVAPKPLFGLTAGLFNLCANLAGIVTPLVVGVIVSATGSFAWALSYIAVVAAAGALSYIFLLGDVRRVELPGA